MLQITVSKRYTNAQRLHWAVETVVGANFAGVIHSEEHGIVTLNFLDDLTEQTEIDAAIAIVEAFSPIVLQRSRTGEEVTITIWLPYDDTPQDVQVVIDQINLPSAISLTTDTVNGVSAEVTIFDDEAFDVTVVNFDSVILSVEANDA